LLPSPRDYLCIKLLSGVYPVISPSTYVDEETIVLSLHRRMSIARCRDITSARHRIGTRLERRGERRRGRATGSRPKKKVRVGCILMFQRRHPVVRFFLSVGRAAPRSASPSNQSDQVLPGSALSIPGPEVRECLPDALTTE